MNLKQNINVVSAAGVNDITNFDGLLSAYPNPSAGIVNLKLTAAQPENVQVSVYDMLGKLIYHTQINGNDMQVNELNLLNQPKGFYILKVQTSEKSSSKKLQIN